MHLKYILVVGLALWLSGCTSQHKPAASGHAHDEIKLSITSYSKDYEVFAEADPFAKDKSSEILAHFTHLADFSPLKGASVKAKLSVNGSVYQDVQEKALRDGIYKFRIKPEQSGKAKLTFLIKLNGQEAAIVASGLTVYSNDHDAIHKAEEQSPSSPNATTFTKEQSWKTEFATRMPYPHGVGQVIKTSAKVSPLPSEEWVITAKSKGIIHYSIDDMVVGTKTSKGQKLFSLLSGGLVNENISVKYQEAENNLKEAKANYERLKKLLKDKIVSEKQFLKAETDYKNTKAIFDNLNANFNMSGQSITSSGSGYVKQLMVSNGQYVKEGQALAIISSSNRVFLHADIQQKHAQLLPLIQDGFVKSHNDKSGFRFEDLEATIVSYGKTTNPHNYMIPLKIRIANKAGFIPGSFVELSLKTGATNAGLSIPNTAILESQGVYFVYVQLTPEHFEKREVTLGQSDGENTEVLQGLTANERIVSKGALMVKLAQATGNLDAHSGHNH